MDQEQYPEELAEPTNLSEAEFTPQYKNQRRKKTPLYVIYSIVYWFCYTGATVRFYLNRLKRDFFFHGKRLFVAVTAWAVVAWRQVKKSAKRSFVDFLDIFRKTAYRQRKEKAKILASGGSTLATRTLIGVTSVRNYSQMTGKLLLGAVNFVVPVLAAAFLIYTVNFFSTMNYGIEVSLENKVLGYIQSEEIYENAERIMQKRIYYREGDEVLYTTPTFRMAVVSSKSFLEPEALSDKIIMATEAEIQEAYGLYVNDEFRGATTEKQVMVEAINGILGRYRTGETQESVNFVDQVQLRSGLYLNSSILPAQTMIDTITGNVQDSATYEVQPKDTLSGIASKLNMTTADLMAMNPGLTINIKPGQVLLAQVSKPSLTVKKTAVITHEDVLKFESTQEEVPTQYRGYTKKKQAGKDGTAIYQYLVTSVNGVEKSRETIDAQIVLEPVQEIIQVGTKNLPIPATTAAPAGGTATGGGTGQGSGQFVWPVQSGGRITCGWLCYRGHTAVDIQTFAGDGILAVDGGQVISVRFDRTGYGYHVYIDHGNGWQSLYAHMNAIYVVQGQMVTKGQKIGGMGRTGRATGIHLHLELKFNGQAVVPVKYLP